MKVMQNAFLLLNISIASHLWQSPKSSHTFPKYPFCGASPSRTTGTHQQATLPSSAPSKSPKPLSALPAQGLCGCFPPFLPKTHRSPSLTPLLTWHSSRSSWQAWLATLSAHSSFGSRGPAFPFHSLPQPSTFHPALTHLPSLTSLSLLVFLHWPPPWAPKRFRQGEEKRIIKEYLRALRIKKYKD